VRRSTELDPKSGEHFFWLGALEEQQKNRGAAMDAYEKSIVLEPSGELAAKANRQLGFNRLLARQWKAALPYLRRSVELDPKDTQAWLWLAQGSQNAGDRGAAADGYRHVLELDPQNAQAKKGLRSLGPTAAAETPASGRD
jgi:predicted TPR repeat methyltransferase